MYTIKEASARSGVGVPLLRAWERRYGVVEPTRTPAGYRLYDDVAIARLAAMRRLIEDGWAPQQAAAQVRERDSAELAELQVAAAGRPERDASAEVAGPTASEALVERILEAARQLDGPALDETLDETLGTLRFETAWEAVIMPALHRIGDAWQAGEVTVAGEHVTSQAIHRRLAMAFDAAAAATREEPVLVGLPPGARHEFGALAFAIAARRAGLPVLYLGPDLPVESWRAAVEERSAPAAVLGVPRRADASPARAVIDALRRERPSIVVAVGGAGATYARTGDTIIVGLGSLVDGVDLLRDGLRDRHA